MFKKKDDPIETFKRHATEEPEATAAAIKVIELTIEGKEIAQKASNDAIDDMSELLQLKGKQRKIAFLIKNARLIGAMQAVSEHAIPQIYNDLHDKLPKAGLDEHQTEMAANYYLGSMVAGILKRIEKAEAANE